MSNAIGSVRKALLDIHMIQEEGKKPKNRYDSKNRKPKAEFIEDLKRMAALGWILWDALLGSRPDLQEQLTTGLKQPSAIQVCRVSGSAFIFPWAMIYDIPLEFDNTYQRYTNCRLLDEWDAAGTLIPPSGSRCPYENSHGLNVICPFGLWGFKHTIEQPPSMPKGRDLQSKIVIGNQPLEMVMGVSLTLDPTVTSDHIAELKRLLPKFNIGVENSLAKIRAAFDKPKLEIIYFYCHGRRKVLAGSERAVPILEVGTGDFFASSDLLAWKLGKPWPESHWQETSPLVFINGCNTAELTPDLLVNFVDNFFGQYASGVIGTEVILHEYVASEAAAEFFNHFQTENVGRALQLMRRHLLLKGNLMGLAYTPYCSTALSF